MSASVTIKDEIEAYNEMIKIENKLNSDLGYLYWKKYKINYNNFNRNNVRSSNYK